MFKKFLGSIALSCALLSSANAAQTIYSSAYEAQKEALEKAQLMVIVVVAESCPYCQRMLNDMSLNRDLMELIGEYYVLSIVDVEKDGLVPNDLGWDGRTPTTFITTPTGKLIGSGMPGAINSNDLYKLLQATQMVKYEKVGF